MMQCMLIAWWSIWCNALLCGKSELKCGSGHCYHKMRMEDGGGDYSLQGLFPLLFISQDKRSREYLSTHVGEDHYRGNYASCDHTKARWCVCEACQLYKHTQTQPAQSRTNFGWKRLLVMAKVQRKYSIKIKVHRWNSQCLRVGYTRTQSNNSLYEGNSMHWAPHNYVISSLRLATVIGTP